MKLFSMLACVLLAVTGCSPVATQAARPARSSLGCVETVLAERMPAYEQDAEAHCIAAGLIARYCSPAEAFIASVGKEIRDLFTSGDAQWRDLRADRHGIRCAQSANTDAETRECCNELR